MAGRGAVMENRGTRIGGRDKIFGETSTGVEVVSTGKCRRSGVICVKERPLGVGRPECLKVTTF